MYRPAVWLVVVLSIGLFCGCGRKDSASLPPRTARLALVTVADEARQSLSPEAGEALLQVAHWLDRDIGRRLRDRGFDVVLLPEAKSHKGNMGPLLISRIKSFEPGIAANLPQGKASQLPSALIIDYRLQDEHGALLDQWQDGAESIKGGTYCARTLNRKAAERIAAVFRER